MSLYHPTFWGKLQDRSKGRLGYSAETPGFWVEHPSQLLPLDQAADSLPTGAYRPRWTDDFGHSPDADIAGFIVQPNHKAQDILGGRKVNNRVDDIFTARRVVDELLRATLLATIVENSEYVLLVEAKRRSKELHACHSVDTEFIRQSRFFFKKSTVPIFFALAKSRTMQNHKFSCDYYTHMILLRNVRKMRYNTRAYGRKKIAGNIFWGNRGSHWF